VRRFVLSSMVLALTSSGAFSQSLVSHAYSRIDGFNSKSSRLCKTIEKSGYKENPVVTERCPDGPGGWAVTMYSADARSYVQFGKSSAEGTTVFDALEGAFADPYGVVEWRILDGRPFAAIHRYQVGTASILTVHRLQPDKTSCIAAVVKPRPGRNANEDANEIADRIGLTFRCGKSAFLVDGKPQAVSSRD
jgi:hypothetical protein